MKRTLQHILLLTLLTSCTPTPQSPRIASTDGVRVEPSNWWVGMRNPVVQLMVRAEGIGHLTPSLDVDCGATVGDVVRTDNPNYIFVDLDLSQVSRPDTLCLVFRGKGSAPVVVNYPLLERRKGSASRQGFSQSDAIYLAMPDRFANSTDENDNMPGMRETANRYAPTGRHGGDLQGVIDHLDYISDLGMTALWLTPVLENNMDGASYHGYAITDFYNVDARLGTNGDFARLSAELHRRDMKNVMDMVFNHCGANHWWMSDLPCKDWINTWDGDIVRSNYRLTTVRDPHASRSDRDVTLRGWFDASMPDMNLDNTLVRNYFIQNSIWWIETADLDGIRQDTYAYSSPEAMAEWNRRIASEYPNFNIVGEVWMSEAAKVAIWQKDAISADGFNSELPTVMDFPLQSILCEAVLESWGGEKLFEHFGNDALYPTTSNILVFGENHDTGRLLSMLRHDEGALRMAYALLATIRGIPQLYYGSEALMAGNGWEGDANIRQDMPGGWAGDHQDFFAHMPERERSMHDFVARLFNFRKQSASLCKGIMRHYQPLNNVYAFVRQADGASQVFVAMNPTWADQSLPLSRMMADGGIPSDGIRGVDVCTGNRVSASDYLHVPARSVMVIDMESNLKR